MRSGPRSFADRFWGWFAAHPIVALLALSPGIPEYVSSSSPLSGIVLDPFSFLFGVAANLALYGTGVLLVREARVRWDLGWASVLVLGAAYGVLEEGIALSTIFNAQSSVVGALGPYGHLLGVNWVWATGVLAYHAVFSITLPIALLGIALPSTEGRSLLAGRGLAIAFGILTADVLLLAVVIYRVYGFWYGVPLLVASLLAIAVAVALARAIPRRWPPVREGPPTLTPWRAAFLGSAFFIGLLVLEGLFVSLRLPPAGAIVALLLLDGLILWTAAGGVGTVRSDHVRLAFIIGLLAPLAAFGALAEYSLPIVLLVDVVSAGFLLRLWRRKPPVEGPAPEGPFVRA